MIESEESYKNKRDVTYKSRPTWSPNCVRRKDDKFSIFEAAFETFMGILFFDFFGKIFFILVIVFDSIE